MTYGLLTFKDRSKEKATMSFNLAPIAADGSNYALIKTGFNTIKAAVVAVTEGTLLEEAIVAERTRLDNTIPADGRREQKFLVTYEDDTTKRVYNMEIPLSDEVAVVYANGTDFWDMANENAAMLAVRSALETHAKSPTGGSITLLTVESVGRNN